MFTKTKIAFAAALILSTASATLAGQDDRNDRGGFVIPCSLVGVNPVHHPEIFGNAAAAQSYGFVQGADRTWHVRADCRR